MAKYPKLLIEHFQNPKNTGEILDPDGVGTVGNASCGDIMQMFIRVNGNRILQATFKTFGCGAAIATSSILTERIKGVRISIYPSLFNGNTRNIPMSANRFGKTLMALFLPIKIALTILISFKRQYSTKSEMLKKCRLGVSCHA